MCCMAVTAIVLAVAPLPLPLNKFYEFYVIFWSFLGVFVWLSSGLLQYILLCSLRIHQFVAESRFFKQIWWQFFQISLSSQPRRSFSMLYVCCFLSIGKSTLNCPRLSLQMELNLFSVVTKYQFLLLFVFLLIIDIKISHQRIQQTFNSKRLISFELFVCIIYLYIDYM